MAMIVGDYIDKDGNHGTIIPFGNNEWECVENLRKMAERDGVRVDVRRENTRGDGAITTVPSAPFISF